MAGGNGDSGQDKTQEILAALLAHAAANDQLIDAADKNMDALFAHARQLDQQIDMLRATVKDTNSSVHGLIGAIRDLIDRIPPENLV